MTAQISKSVSVKSSRMGRMGPAWRRYVRYVHEAFQDG